MLSPHRLIGFWHAKDKRYHWYITNLQVCAQAIYPLYRIKGQIELIFKSCKSSLNLGNKLTLNHTPIIESRVIASMIALMATHVVLKMGIKQLDSAERLAVSFQRAGYLVVVLSRDFFDFVVNGCRTYAIALMDKIKLLSTELYEKNHYHRSTSLQRINDVLQAGGNHEHL